MGIPFNVDKRQRVHLFAQSLSVICDRRMTAGAPLARAQAEGLPETGCQERAWEEKPHWAAMLARARFPLMMAIGVQHQHPGAVARADRCRAASR